MTYIWDNCRKAGLTIALSMIPPSRWKMSKVRLNIMVLVLKFSVLLYMPWKTKDQITFKNTVVGKFLELKMVQFLFFIGNFKFPAWFLWFVIIWNFTIEKLHFFVPKMVDHCTLTGSTWWIFGKFGKRIGGSKTSPHWFPSSLIDGKVDIPRGTGLWKLNKLALL